MQMHMKYFIAVYTHQLYIIFQITILVKYILKKHLWNTEFFHWSNIHLTKNLQKSCTCSLRQQFTSCQSKSSHWLIKKPRENNCFCNMHIKYVFGKCINCIMFSKLLFIYKIFPRNIFEDITINTQKLWKIRHSIVITLFGTEPKYILHTSSHYGAKCTNSPPRYNHKQAKYIS